MCEFCGDDRPYKTPMQRLITELEDMVASGYSEAYMEAVLYGRHRNTVSIHKIAELIVVKKQELTTK